MNMTNEQNTIEKGTRSRGPDNQASSSSHMSKAAYTQSSSDSTIIDQNDDDTESLLSDSSTLYNSSSDSINGFAIYEECDDTVTLAEGNDTNSLAIDKKPIAMLIRDEFPFTRVKFVGINVKPNTSDNKGAATSTILSVRSIVRETRDDIINNRSKERWRVEKTLEDFLILDMHLRKSGFNGARLPENSILTSNVPTKVALRKLMLEQYIRLVMKSSLKNDDTVSYLSAFLNSDLFDSNNRAKHQWLGCKEGVLTKKRKLLSGWISRYFVLDGTQLEYFEYKGGKLLGSIPLHKAKIGSQMAHELGKPITTDYLHALTVDAIQMKGITPQYVRHALCANTDEERDEWVRAITRAARSLDVKEAKTDRKKHSRENPPTVKFHRISVANLKRMDTEGPSLIKQQPMLTKLAKGESGKKPL